MTKDRIQQYTLRITQANKTEMIVILYEMLLDYLEESRTALEKKELEEFYAAVRRTRGCLEELIRSLNLSYSPAGELLSLYVYANKELIKAEIRKQEEPLFHVRDMVSKLLEAYRELAKLDDSKPVMENSQTIYAGMTYGKDSLTENMADQGANRGFRA